jgi:hypothetical protein
VVKSNERTSTVQVAKPCCRTCPIPTDIVVSNGFIYWTEDGNSVRRVNISGQKIAIDVAVNLGTVGGLAVGGGKVYWTETDGCIGR